ncbi:isochorismatase family cysteine hydrolase [Mycolicibacterium vaccae]|uniref:isochorismatase family cysteine hydrolase n=1 Tax=Mycolicibacterium vaccae TaxID=1810 RepID=UPI003CF20697
MSDTVVLVVDMMNTYEHEDAEVLASNVAEVIDPLSQLVAEARRRDDVDLIYVNDNYGDFSVAFGDLVDNALKGARPDLVEPIKPDEGCRFMTKVRHSAFYATPLAYLLNQLQPQRLVLTGQVTEQCILYTALDAYVRHFPVVVPRDAVAHIDAGLGEAALRMMAENMDADIVPAAECLR